MSDAGEMLLRAWVEDPKRLGFTHARYKFVAKMFRGFDHVLEVGANSGYMSRIVSQQVIEVTLTDKQAFPNVAAMDYCVSHYPAEFDGVYALDVLEHIAPENEDAFMTNVCRSLRKYGSCIIGMPSLESQKYASENSFREHVNCKTEDELREFMQKYFKCVYMFGMNDETLHTGFGPMCQYRFALCNTKLH